MQETLKKSGLIKSNIHTKNKHILPKQVLEESGGLLWDILKTENIRHMNWFLVTMDIEKAFDSLDINS